MTFNELNFNQGSVWIFIVLQDSPVPEGVNHLKNAFLLSVSQRLRNFFKSEHYFLENTNQMD